MKKLFLLAFVSVSIIGFSQDTARFELTKDGVLPIVVKLDSLSAKFIYSKTLNWVQENYKNPKEVLKANIENETIRIDGFKKEACFFKSLGIKTIFDMDYSFQIDIKDNKVRLTFTPGQFWSENQKVFSVGYSYFFKNSGEIKGGYKDAKPSMEQSMNDLVSSLCNYIKGTKKSDW
jgi:hypothetical protein